MIRVFKSDNQGDKFYALMGRNFSSLDIAKEMERQIYNVPDTTWYVQTVQNCPIAFVSVTEHKNHYFIDNLYVHSGWRKIGLADELIERVVEDITDKPLKCIACNPYALKIFQRYGFVKEGNNGKYTKLCKH